MINDTRSRLFPHLNDDLTDVRSLLHVAESFLYG